MSGRGYKPGFLHLHFRIISKLLNSHQAKCPKEKAVVNWTYSLASWRYCRKCSLGSELNRIATEIYRHNWRSIPK